MKLRQIEPINIPMNITHKPIQPARGKVEEWLPHSE
jgi:hypothetical protein